MVLVFFFGTGVITENMVCPTHMLFYAHQSLNNWFDTFLYSPQPFSITFSIVDKHLEYYHIQIDVLSVDFGAMF